MPAAIARPGGVLHSGVARIPSLEAARGVAALMVVAIHVGTWHGTRGVPQDAWLGFTSRGWLGVQVFFVLSGLVLYLPYAKGARLDLGDYAAARILRLVPGLWFALAISATLAGLWSWQTVRHGLLVNPDAGGSDPIPPAWTLTIEAGFYLLLPVLVWLFAKWPQWRIPALIALVGFGMLARYGYDNGATRHPGTFIDQFALGMLAAIVVARVHRVPRVALLLAATALTAGLLVVDENGNRSAIGLALVATCFAVGLGSLALVNPSVPRVLVWLGTISYGIYLWHWPVIALLSAHGLFRLPDATEIPVAFAASALMGWLSWRLVEKPAILLRRRRHRPLALPVDHRPRPAVAAAGVE